MLPFDVFIELVCKPVRDNWCLPDHQTVSGEFCASGLGVLFILSSNPVFILLEEDHINLRIP
jgi:hypothetical protein